MGTIRLGKRTDNRSPLIKDFVPLAKLEDIVFGGWDLFPDDAYQAASKAGVLSKEHLDGAQGASSSAIKPMTAVFDQDYVKKLTATHVKKGKNKMDLAEQVIEDIEDVQEDQQLRPPGDGLVRLDRGLPRARRRSTPRWPPSRRGCCENDPDIAPSQIYAYAALKSGVPFANGAPNLTVDIPALLELARQNGVPIGGKDFKTGQTLDEDDPRARLQGAPARRRGLVLDQHPRQPRRRGARRSRVVQDQGGVEAGRARAHPAAAPLPRPLRRHAPRRAHQLLPAARRQQRGLGQHRYLRVARLPDADQDRLPLPRLDPGGADRARPRAVHGPRAALRA